MKIRRLCIWRTGHGGGTATQVVRSAVAVKGLNPRGKIVDVNVGVRATHQQATDLEFYLAVQNEGQKLSVPGIRH